MRFDSASGSNPIDRMVVVGKALDRVDGPLKTTGTAAYAYEHHREVANPAYGFMVGAAIAKGRNRSVDLAEARAAPGVLAVVTAADAGQLVGTLGKGKFNTVKLLAGPDVDHYHQTVAVVVAESFEQARAAAALVRVDCARAEGQFDLAEALKTAPLKGGSSDEGQRRVTRRTGRRFRAGLRRGTRQARRRVHHARPQPRDDGAFRVHRRTARRRADALDLQPDDRLGPDGPRGHAGMDPIAFRAKNDTQVDPETVAPFGARVAYHFTGLAPDSMRVDADGHVYVALYGQGRILVFSRDGLPIGQILLPGRDAGRNLYLTSMAIRPGSRDMAVVTSDGRPGGTATIFHARAWSNGLPARVPRQSQAR